MKFSARPDIDQASKDTVIFVDLPNQDWYLSVPLISDKPSRVTIEWMAYSDRRSCSTLSTTVRPMPSEDVAAGEGTLRTCSILLEGKK